MFRFWRHSISVQAALELIASDKGTPECPLSRLNTYLGQSKHTVVCKRMGTPGLQTE